MTLEETLCVLELSGAVLALGPEGPRIDVPEEALPALAESIRTFRKELALLLHPDLEAIVASWGMPDTAEAISERAAIMEFDGGLPRGLAYRLAVVSTGSLGAPVETLDIPTSSKTTEYKAFCETETCRVGSKTMCVCKRKNWGEKKQSEGRGTPCPGT